MRLAMISFGLTVALAAGAAQAGPKDYRFEAVATEVPAATNAVVAVRLVHLPDGKPVTNAVLFQAKMAMPMDGMAPMPTKLAPGLPDGKGGYPFTADLSMSGPWELTVSAKVQGEPATIVGAVQFLATH